MQKTGITKRDSYYKMRQTTIIKNLLQSVTEVSYKVRQVLQSIKKRDSYYKVRRNIGHKFFNVFFCMKILT